MHTSALLLRVVLMAGVVSIGGCFGGSGRDLAQLEVALAAAASVAHAASIAVTSMTAPTACANVTRACGTTFPCDGEVTIVLGEGCPLPLGGVATGTVAVSGRWGAAADATVTSAWTQVATDEGQVVVRSSTGVRAAGAGGDVTVSLVGQDVSVTGATALAAQATLSVTVEGAGTPDDPSDDAYTIAVTQQGVAGASTRQLTLSNVRLDPSCRRNPVAGQATIQEVGGLSVRQDVVRFHSACDGKADVSGTFGGNESVPLHFLR